MAVLLLAEVTNGELNRDATGKAVGAVASLGDVTVLCAGSQARAAADQAASIAGVSRVLVAEDARYGHRLAEPTAALIVTLAGGYSHIAAPATTDAKNVMPRVAALLDVMVMSDVSAVIDADTFERPVYAGNAIQTVKSADATKIMTIRVASFDAAGEGPAAPVSDATLADDPALSKWLNDEVAQSDRPELTSAGRVVSGGRALGSKEQFAIIESLADKLGAAVGASRAAVDSGYAPNDWQGGQTGRHLRRDPASGRHEGQQGHRGHQQGRRGADLPDRRLRPGGRPVHVGPGTDRKTVTNAAAPHHSGGRFCIAAGVARPYRPGDGTGDAAMAIQSVGVIGAGQMGNGIAHVFAVAGYDVLLTDISQEALDKAVSLIDRNLERQVSRDKITPDVKATAMGHIRTTLKLSDLGRCDLVIEAATERETVKQAIFEDLVPHLKPETILTSNTSSISITRLASRTDRPEKFMGFHFMNPVPVMQLVELIRGIATDEPTYKALHEVVEKLGKTSATAEDFPAFIVNRILMPMINEAVYTLYEGVGSVSSIDSAMKLGTNHPMGPLELADFIGLDTCLAIMNVLHDGLADTKYRPCPLLTKYVEAGWLGRKTGRGFYDYRGDTPVPTR